MIVDNSMRIYNIVNLCFGSQLASFLVKSTVGRVFTGGSNL